MTIAYWLERNDDDDYREQEEHDRRRYWTFGANGTTYFRIPKPRDEAVFLNVVEGILDSYKHGDEAISADDTFVDDMMDRVPVGGGVGRATFEVVSNWDFFRDRPLEPEWMQAQPVEYRENQYTTEMSKTLSRGLGKFLGMSPIELDHLLDSSTGGAYRRWNDLLESGYASATGELPSRKLGLKNVPFIGRFFPNRHQSRSLNDFYEALEAAQIDAKRAVLEGKSGAKEKAKAARLAEYAKLMSAVREAEPADGEGRRGYEYQRYLVGLAREALDREPLEDNPSLLSDKSPPEELKQVVNEFAGRQLAVGYREDGRPQPPKRADFKTDTEYQDKVADYEDRLEQWTERRDAAYQWVKRYWDQPFMKEAIKEMMPRKVKQRPDGESEAEYKARLDKWSELQKVAYK
jgi:hypothetical protein